MFDQLFNDPFTCKVVREWSRWLCRRPEFFGVEREDVEQELWLSLWQGFHRFDASVAHRNALVTAIIARRAGMMLRAASAKKRNGQCQSLEAMLAEDDSGTLDNLAVWDDALSEFEFDHDLMTALNGAPAELVDLARRLTWQSVSEVARDSGVGRGAIRRRVDHLRDILSAHYFGESS